MVDLIKFKSTSGFVAPKSSALRSQSVHSCTYSLSKRFPYEINPYQIWGVGVAENMEDAQMLMNGHVRMAIDNLALAGNLVFDVDEASLVPGQNMDIFPGKIFRRQSGVTGTAINGLKFPNTAPENIQMYQISRQLADEETVCRLSCTVRQVLLAQDAPHPVSLCCWVVQVCLSRRSSRTSTISS